MSNRCNQDFMDKFYIKHGKPCCAGCDWWRWHNSLIGDCTRHAPVSSAESLSLSGIESCSLDAGASHIATKRDYVCGDFIDSDNLLVQL